MPIERITADDLRDMEHQEGLVLQGCGGCTAGGAVYCGKHLI